MGVNRLEDRRVRGDFIEMYKSENGLDARLIGKGIKWLIRQNLES